MRDQQLHTPISEGNHGFGIALDIPPSYRGWAPLFRVPEVTMGWLYNRNGWPTLVRTRSIFISGCEVMFQAQNTGTTAQGKHSGLFVWQLYTWRFLEELMEGIVQHHIHRLIRMGAMRCLRRLKCVLHPKFCRRSLASVQRFACVVRFFW